MPKPANLFGRANSDCCSSPGESRPAKAGINFVNNAFSSGWKEDDTLGTVRDTYNHLLIKP